VRAESGELTMQARPVLVVLDTNVVISGLLWEGTPRELLARAIQGRGLLLAASAVLLQELAATLSLPRFAVCIVTGDRSHLLPIGVHADIAIISPRQCLELLDS